MEEELNNFTQNRKHLFNIYTVNLHFYYLLSIKICKINYFRNSLNSIKAGPGHLCTWFFGRCSLHNRGRGHKNLKLLLELTNSEPSVF